MKLFIVVSAWLALTSAVQAQTQIIERHIQKLGEVVMMRGNPSQKEVAAYMKKLDKEAKQLELESKGFSVVGSYQDVGTALFFKSDAKKMQVPPLELKVRGGEVFFGFKDQNGRLLSKIDVEKLKTRIHHEQAYLSSQYKLETIQSKCSCSASAFTTADKMKVMEESLGLLDKLINSNEKKPLHLTGTNSSLEIYSTAMRLLHNPQHVDALLKMEDPAGVEALARNTISGKLVSNSQKGDHAVTDQTHQTIFVPTVKIKRGI